MTLARIFCLIMFFLYELSPYLSFGSSFNITTDTLTIGTPKNYTLNDETVYIIEVKNLSNIIERVPPRIFIKCEKCIETNPLLVVVMQNKGILSWELPVVIELDSERSVYRTTERTLCPYDILSFTDVRHLQNGQTDNETIHPVTLSLSTSSNQYVTAELIVNLEENFVLDLDNNKSVKVTPSTPAFYLFEFDSANVTSVILHVTSDDDICMIVSVQNVTCPVFDLEENVGYRGVFQTVTRLGGLTVTKDSFPKGFYVVLIVSSFEKYCSGKLLHSASDTVKNVDISLLKTISSDDYNIALGVTALVIVVFCALMFIIFYFSFKRQNAELQNLEPEVILNADSVSASLLQNSLHAATSPVTPVTPATPAPTLPGDNLSIKTDSSLDEADIDFVNDAELDKNISRMKNFLYLNDLSRKNESVLKKKSELYFWNLVTVAIFYFLPTFQLVFNDQYQANESGREDLCYRNFLCSHQLWVFSDFNHMFSNIGYISFGALFMFLTAIKERDYKLKISRNAKLYRNYGIPQHFGIFYAMGASLIIEGFLSLCYHICPNRYNFQFDTSFMYVICTLCMIKIYQSRHPDISASAYATFTLLAGVIVLGMYGVFSNSLTFRILFTIAHLSTCIYLSLQIYYIGRFRLEFINVVRWCKELKPCCKCQLRSLSPMFPSRFNLLALVNACNWGLAVGSFVYDIKNFSSYLLIIFMVNLVLYTAFYILMKFICKEKLLLQSIIYIFLATLCWAAALYFFFSRTISWKLTPAESKLYNQKCKLLNFYDNHDIWHFISAGAMFFSFMVLLTLDDNLFYTSRSEIIVF